MPRTALVLLLLASFAPCAVLAQGEEAAVQPRELPTLEELWEYPMEEGARTWISAITFAAEGDRMAIGCGEEVWLLSRSTGERLRRILPRAGSPAALALSADGARLAVLGVHRRALVSLWDTETGGRLWSRPFSVSGGYGLRFTAGDAELLLANQERSLRLQASTGEPLSETRFAEARAKVTSDARRLLARAPDGRSASWRDAETDRELRRLEFPTAAGHPFHAASGCAVCAGEDRLGIVAQRGNGELDSDGYRREVLWQWNLASGERLTTIEPPPRHSMSAIAYSPDGLLVATGGPRRLVRRGAEDSRTEISELPAAVQSSGWIDLRRGVVWWLPHDIRHRDLMSAVIVWNSETGEPLAAIPHPGFDVSLLRFSPTGRELVVIGSGNGSVIDTRALPRVTSVRGGADAGLTRGRVSQDPAEQGARLHVYSLGEIRRER